MAKKESRTFQKLVAMLGGIGLLFMIMYAEAAGEIGNAIVAFTGLSGGKEGWLWVFIACSTGIFAGYMWRRDKHGT